MKITANMVTVGRIALLPLPTAVLVFGNTFQVWLATVFAIALGATDAVDGYLARRDGPTVLGALLDPVADKLFLAAFLLPITAKHHAAFWVVSLIFLRELLITALRTSMELRSERLKTSQLGKLKTVVQMGGLAVYVFLLYTEEPFPKVLNAMGVVGLLVVLLVYALRRRPAPHWVAPAFCLWGLVLGATFFLTVEVVTFWVFLGITLVTWVSGADYLLGAARAYREVSLSRDEGVRLFWALANGAALVMVYRHPETLLPVMLMLAAHLSLGGIDNIVTAHENRPVSGGFGWSSALSLVALGASLACAPENWWPPVLASMVAGGAGCVVAVAALLRHKEVFFPKGTAHG